MKSLVIALIVIVAFFQNWLLSVIPFFGNLDEIIALTSLLYYLHSRKNDWGRERKIVIPAVVVIVVGLLFNAVFHIQNSYMALVEDVLGIFKFLFTYLGLKQYLYNSGVNTALILKYVMKFVCVYLLVLSLFAGLNLVSPIGMDAGYRYGLRMFSFVYGTPGHLINQMTYALILLESHRILNYKRIVLWEVLACFIMVCTLKTRAFTLMLIFFSLKYFILGKIRIRLRTLVPVMALLAYLVGYSQFEYYFIADDAAPRAMFVNTAAKIVREDFPWGTGFGTFGSSAAAKYYSPLYVKYGFSERWGMTKDNQLFLNDNYLPMIFVQFGFLLTIIFLIMVYRYCRLVIGECTNKFSKFIGIFFVFDILQSSLQSSYLAHYSVVTLTFIFLICCYPNRRMGTV
ncbi:hypothetical protein [Fibrobacter sp. UWEL]|uniref:hypothetical protein n=1 Tax=Fibrobacter sp. UWEL TaxID=1896209 RepID=UPI00091C8DED|nr:hypothetical protein [Fibrobacter sp. UWEL]SHK64684.1 hypothetical protein SAMN05720468_104162 [Fibrobacter sp. UWEL]